MGRMRQRMFKWPGLGDKTLIPANLQTLSDLMQAGWYKFDGVDGFNQPFTYLLLYHGALVAKNTGCGVIGEYTPPWDSAYFNHLSARRNFVSAVIEFSHVGFVAGNNQTQVATFGFFGWNSGYPHEFYTFHYSRSGFPPQHDYLVCSSHGTNINVGQSNTINNIVKINLTKNGANKDLKFWAYSQGIGDFLDSETTVLGQGDDIPVFFYNPGTNQTADGGCPCLIHRIIVSTTDIDITGQKPCIS